MTKGCWSLLKIQDHLSFGLRDSGRKSRQPCNIVSYWTAEPKESYQAYKNLFTRAKLLGHTSLNLLSCVFICLFFPHFHRLTKIRVNLQCQLPRLYLTFTISMLSSWLVICHLRMDLLIRAAVKVVPLEWAMSRTFWFVFSGWSFLSVSRLVV